jgi:signal transduction histidine kinase
MGILAIFRECRPRNHASPLLKKMPKSRDLYLGFISLLGLILVIAGLTRLPSFEQPIIFVLLVALAIAAQFASTPLMRGRVTVEVSTAVSLATVPLYGPLAAVVVAGVASAVLTWLSIRADRPGWRRTIERLGFNVGMSGIAIFAAGLVFQASQTFLGADTFVGSTLPWLLAAIANDQINIWLLITLLYLQHGTRPLEIWLENRWAMPINVLVTAVGGGLLALAIGQFDYLGIAVFFLPVLLSAYAFRLYVTKTQGELTKLEELVELRTQALEEANEALKDANQELANLHSEKDTFLGVLSHDMRSPLTSIQGYTSFILSQPDLTEDEKKHMLEVIRRSGQTLLEMVNNILEIQQLQAGNPILLECESFELGKLIFETIETIEAQAIEKKVKLEYMRPADPIVIYADKPKVRRIVTNLVTNAVKYTPGGGNVCVNTAINGRYAIVQIQDNGYGIPAEDLPYIFERFRRVRKHQTLAAGTGLGLAIVKSMIEAHKGEITAESQEGIGSTFTMKLPL